MGRAGIAVVAAALAGPAAAQERLSVAFDYRSVDLSTLGLLAGEEAYLLETTVTVEPGPGPLDGLRGRCLLPGTRAAGHEAVGRCALTDAAGDRLLLEVAERSAPGQGPEGQGAWAGGTGRFEGASGGFTYALVFYALRPGGVIEGTGRPDGAIALGPAAPPAEEPPFRLVLPEAP